MEVAGSWSVTYIAEQQLWADPCAPTRNLGLLAVIGSASSKNSPFETTLHIKCEGSGLCCKRPNDRVGIGYFYSGLSGDFKTCWIFSQSVIFKAAKSTTTPR